MSKKKQVIFDMILNIIAATIPIAVLQFIVYPLTAKDVGDDAYGLMLTIYSLWMMISSSIGGVLNIVRVIRNNDYLEKEIEGDFNIIYRKWNVICGLAICVVFLFYYDGFEPIHILLGIIVSFLIVTKSYTEVGFRIILNYKAILINNILLSIGYLVGFVALYITGYWEFIFLFGYLFSSIYCVIKTKLLKERFVKTHLYKSVNRDIDQLAVASIISGFMTYADKLVLYPLMGGTAVSIYYTASILGKVVGMLTSPINSVILSYISKWKTNQRSMINKLLLIGIGLCVVGYIITLIIARPIIGLLFPQWLDQVMKYIPITTINVLLLVLISFLSPFVLKFCEMKWQIVINSASIVVYLTSALILWKQFGLTGFCIGTIIGTLTKLVIMLVVYYKNDMSELKEID